jgi:hypothetical protein
MIRWIKFYLIFGLISINLSCFGEIKPIPADYRDKIVNSIYLAEGGNKTKYPYGIKSIKTSNPKRICENTVSNNYLRWQRAGKTNDFISFLGNRYCPIGAKDDPHNLNSNWIKNVNKFLKNS